ncbi:unnamed protein product [Linum tenue]|uniref:Uncharacterized protein n=1 Tax=Linum tenue TaxID=586396 RepID=A0AAV0NM94_9ROSI|nr:unnamed protein product [Linum tenue]
MLPKRRFDAQWAEEEEEEVNAGHGAAAGGRSSSIPSPKRFRNAVRDVLGKQSMADFASSMEPFLRSVIRDEVEKTVAQLLSRRPSFGSSRTSFQESGVKKGLALHFVNKLPSRIFTNGRIEAEDGNPVRIVLLDAASNAIVTSGPLSSLKIEIVVLDGDFGSDDREDWCAKDFDGSVIKEREGRRPLVAGELSVVLKHGVGRISDVVFTDNSSWQRSRRFRLGARAVQRGDSKEAVRIREARSEPFVVKDHRGELYKKHYPPKLGDEVWRLERIAKEGAFHKRLSANGISTVKEFLKAYVVDQTTLRSILGGGISNRIWDSIVEHASTCVLDDEAKFYVYNDHAQGVRLLLNSVYKLVGAMFYHEHVYEPLDKLTPPQKVLVENSKRQAYRNLEGLIPMDSHSAFGPSRQLPMPPPAEIQLDPLHISNNLAVRQLDFPVLRHDESELHLDFNNNYNYSTSSSSYDNISPNNAMSPIQLNPFLGASSFKFSGGGGGGGHFSIQHECGGWMQGGGSSSWPEDTAVVAAASPAPWGPLFYTPGTTEEEVAAAFLSSFPSFGANRTDFPTAMEKPKACWCKVRAALKVRSILVARRMWHSEIYL